MRRPGALLACSCSLALVAGCAWRRRRRAATNERARRRARRRRSGRPLRRRAPGGCKHCVEGSPSPQPDGGAEAQADARRSTPAKTYDAASRDELRRLHRSRLDSERVAAGRPRRSSTLVEARLLRRHDLPPHRPRLRDPGRRPAPAPGSGGPGYSPWSSRRRATSVHEGRRRDGQDREPRPPGTSGSQFYIVTAADAGPAARLRAARQGRRAARTWSTDRPSSGDPRASDRRALAAGRPRTKAARHESG